ncbi:MAG: hypothetical protein U9N49_04425 [Campylobacterota bacterium]|nr:hypothetical protein [Campylobacterota bacterium]
MIKIPYPDKFVIKEFYDQNLKNRIINTIERIECDGGLLTNEKKIKTVLDTNARELLKIIKKEQYLKFIITVKPNSLKRVIKFFEKQTNNKIRNKDEAISQIIYNIFVTSTYEKNEYFNKLKFIQRIGLDTCPYCNRSYIYTLNKAGSIKPEIDHFYPKSFYPYLAVSYYNLIPSCQTCNGFGAKGKIDTFNDKKIIHPYEVNVNDFKFTYIPNSINFNLLKQEKYNFNNFEIKFIKSNQDNLDVFKLEELYKQHKDIVLELLVKKAYYPKSYIDELASFGFGEDEIYRYLLGNYKKDEDLHKRPLSKLIKDISEELKLL